MYLFFFTVTSTTFGLFLLLCCVLTLLILDEKRSSSCQQDEGIELREPDGPTPYPIIGSLPLLSGYKVPYQAFGALAQKYGQVFKIKLGSINCVVVNGLDNIKEVLMTKGDDFSGRPNFERYNLIFDGDKRNSLAFCDWSTLQKTRRELLRVHTFPPSYSAKFAGLDAYINSETNLMLEKIQDQIQAEGGATAPFNFKPLLLYNCANIFLLHFCGKRYDYGDASFAKMTYFFDEIFYEVNQGYAADFMPWMLPFYRSHLARFRQWTGHIHQFTSEIVRERSEGRKKGTDGGNADYIDTFIESIKRRDDKELDLEIALYSLEDIIGGHSAIGNFLMKVFAYIVVRPEVQENIKKEIFKITNGQRDVSLTDRRHMQYTEAVIMESIRVIASPFVPHVASQDSSICGLKVKKDTLIFLNNYGLNCDPKLWKDPEQFRPERFIVNNCLVKPDHFFPFSTGKRSCMGYKMVQLLSFNILAMCLQKFTILPVKNCSYEVPVGDLALPYNSFNFIFTPDHRTSK